MVSITDRLNAAVMVVPMILCIGSLVLGAWLVIRMLGHKNGSIRLAVAAFIVSVMTNNNFRAFRLPNDQLWALFEVLNIAIIMCSALAFVGLLCCRLFSTKVHS